MPMEKTTRAAGWSCFQGEESTTSNSQRWTLGIEHDVELQDRLVKRLKSVTQFQGTHRTATSHTYPGDRSRGRGLHERWGFWPIQ
jgi:hypothetical protein